LHIVDGELRDARLPLVPGHQIVGTVDAAGPAAQRFRPGERVGVPWLARACGECSYCRTDRENLCDRAVFTGYTTDGGFAELAVADERYCVPLGGALSDTQTAPLLCAGLIGYRALRMAGATRRLGFFGFGSAAHILTQVARWQGREVFAFTRPGDADAQRFALQLGAVWAGGTDTKPPTALDAALLFAPAGELVPLALSLVHKGGVVVCAGIHMTDIPSFPYSVLWGERVVRSVANLTRRDAEEFMAIAPRVPVRTQVTVHPLDAVVDALAALRSGTVHGSLVVVP
jgi:propanol-preferring alcohol dehydrogenase